MKRPPAPPGALLGALLALAALLQAAAAARCGPGLPEYDLERFQKVSGWRLLPAVALNDSLAFGLCPAVARPGMPWCCQYVSDWSGETGPTTASARAGPAGACLSPAQRMAAACVAQEACMAWSGDRLYLRPAPNSAGGTWNGAPGPPHWQRCKAGEPCPPVFILSDLGPQPYGANPERCSRSFELYTTPASNYSGIGSTRASFKSWPEHFTKRPVLAGPGCAQFEGFIGGKLPYATVRDFLKDPMRRFSWRDLGECGGCSRQAAPGGGGGKSCSLCRRKLMQRHGRERPPHLP